jgi:hypothetical protein
MIGVAALLSTAVSARAVGFIDLDNYSQFGGQITYGGGFGGVTPGTGLQNSGPNGPWTVGLYYALGDLTGSIPSDPTGVADPSTLGPLTLLTGSAGDTTTFNVPGAPGYFAATNSAVISGYSSGLVTFMAVVYNGSSYDSSILRAHSATFTMALATGTQLPPDISSGTLTDPGSVGMPTFSVYIIPEPSAFALAGVGLTVLVAFRPRRSANGAIIK